jgi:hypothetical protein
VRSDLAEYAGLDALWRRFAPETPFGRAAKARAATIVERSALEARWDDADEALRLLDALEGDRVRLDRIRHHLKRLPRFPETPHEAFDEVELFQLKKFLANHRALLALLPEATRVRFSLAELPAALHALLGAGREGDESFHVADAFDPDLAAVREEIRRVDVAAAALRESHEAALRARWGFAFEGRPFLLVPREGLGEPAAAADLLDLEPWDADRLCVRPRPGAGALRLAEEKSALLAREREVEARVLRALSTPLAEALPLFLAQSGAVERLDLALAGARLAREARLVRPVLHDGPVRIAGGRHLPTEELCAELGTPYTPLDAAFDGGSTVIFGSNMGGKTVVLKTLAFLQLAAQAGLFVPAARFETRLFRRFHYVGEGRGREEGRGLSGFGFEIRRLSEAHADFRDDTLALFDELGRTTSSVEAEALLSALLEELAARPRTVALFSTHFRGVRRVPGAAFLRMAGLDRSRLDLAPDGDDLAARIRRIDRLMRFRLEPDAEGPGGSDAIAVARLLGLDPALARRAEELVRRDEQD